MNKPVKTHEITTWSGRNWPLTAQEYNYLKERMEAGAKFLTIPDQDMSNVSLSDVKFLGRRQVSLGDIINEQKALPKGEVKFDKMGQGYIKFLAASVKMRIKKGGNLQAVLAKIDDEQRPLVNKQLEKMGMDYRV